MIKRGALLAAVIGSGLFAGCTISTAPAPTMAEGNAPPPPPPSGYQSNETPPPPVPPNPAAETRPPEPPQPRIPTPPRNVPPVVVAQPPAVGGLPVTMTHGKAKMNGSSMMIRTASARGVAPDSSGDRASLHFRYLGPSADVSKLRSGMVKSQLGLKLRAQNGCNLVYVMWRLAPKPAIDVQYKINPGDSTAEECENGGYHRVLPTLNKKASAQFDPPVVGKDTVLSAAIEGSTLSVFVDGAQVWTGELPAEALALKGPAGFRSDNIEFDGTLTQGDAGTSTTIAPKVQP
jgi:hypothetical protein